MGYQSKRKENGNEQKEPAKKSCIDKGTVKSELKGSENVLMWFRTDIRLEDSRALEAALTCLKRKNEGDDTAYLFGLFIISPGEWKEHDAANIKVDFLLRNVKKLSDRLREFDIPLLIETADAPGDIPNILSKVCTTYNIKDVFYNIEYEVNEAKRDSLVKNQLAEDNIRCVDRHDQCVVPPGSLVTKSSGLPYAVFTPFKNAWIQLIFDEPSHIKASESIPKAPHSKPLKSLLPNLFKELPSDFNVLEGFKLDSKTAKLALELYPSGEDAADSRLEEFIAHKIKAYKTDRDIPSLPGTSVLSPYLTSGVISARKCASKARAANSKKLAASDDGINTWISEVVWRDFYRHVIVAHPRVSKSLPYKMESLKVKWEDNDDHFEAWVQGKTGYPIVDAGMRQLMATGWMHNRVRMITAMFLTKDLLINWQQGEKHFMRHLVDGDLASNNGGWQWSASTGTDAQPYFRIFNPTTQSEKVDPEGKYIRTWVPELSSVKDKKAIHEPYARLPTDKFLSLKYPKPIVKHSAQRLIAIERFAKAFKK